MIATAIGTPDDATPDDATSDDATPDDATPDDATPLSAVRRPSDHASGRRTART
jgi:hypothetical protein